MINVRVEGWEPLARDLDRLQEATFLQRLTFAVGEMARDVIARYPPLPRYPLRWASRRQQIWFWSAVRSGEIEVPYRRLHSPTSQKLGQSWTVESRGVTAIVGTMATYAPYVQSAERQQPFHADTGWITDREAVRQTMANRADIDAAAYAILRRILSGS